MIVGSTWAHAADHVGGDSLFEVDVFAAEAGQLSGVPADVVVEPGPDVRFAPLIKLRRYLGEVGRVLKQVHHLSGLLHTQRHAATGSRIGRADGVTNEEYAGGHYAGLGAVPPIEVGQVASGGRYGRREEPKAAGRGRTSVELCRSGV